MIQPFHAQIFYATEINHLFIQRGFPDGSDGKVSACNAGELSSVPKLGRSPGGVNGNPLQYSCLENPMDRGAWQATVHGITKSWTRLSDFHFTFIQRDFPSGTNGKEPACNAEVRDTGSVPGSRGRRKQQPTPVFLPGKSHGQRSLTGYSPWGCKELDMTQLLKEQQVIRDPGFNMQLQLQNDHSHFSLISMFQESREGKE